MCAHFNTIFLYFFFNKEQILLTLNFLRENFKTLERRHDSHVLQHDSYLSKALTEEQELN